MQTVNERRQWSCVVLDGSLLRDMFMHRSISVHTDSREREGRRELGGMADRREYDCVYLCKAMVYDSICIQACQKCICMYLREPESQSDRHREI